MCDFGMEVRADFILEENFPVSEQPETTTEPRIQSSEERCNEVDINLQITKEEVKEIIKRLKTIKKHPE